MTIVLAKLANFESGWRFDVSRAFFFNLRAQCSSKESFEFFLLIFDTAVCLY